MQLHTVLLKSDIVHSYRNSAVQWAKESEKFEVQVDFPSRKKEQLVLLAETGSTHPMEVFRLCIFGIQPWA
jgi:hypothetical protein